ncbi:hypothetical protein NLG97_g3160 [Lecanicillium saksenae]|uniref:Uncharacterized protein n=1 Tax=Lecanicillium saksenae TaxID=468837 RepID=A0ACC1R0K7_9HYPO|nr:hypothetical protein NLG97_g3160 [Lecanicillium saksenae]
MNTITQGILKKSKLEVHHLKITNATNSSFLLSMKGRATKIGIATATISAMTVDLVGPRGTFGRLEVPAIKMGSRGADIAIVNQWVSITDMEAFAAFVMAIVHDENLILRLENGQTTVTAMGMKSTIVYQKAIHLHGLKNLQTSLLEMEQDESTVQCSIATVNLSQFELDLGTVVYEVQDKNGQRVGELKGKTYVSCGASKVTLHGPVTGMLYTGETKLVGVDVEEQNWLKQIIPKVHVVFTI